MRICFVSCDAAFVAVYVGANTPGFRLFQIFFHNRIRDEILTFS
ncbi:hypothetical protein DR64_6223 [Paraburkholderia xenovorans LB400]|nr:hypothetical protein DR64_6223 [Paraburkholderia xenovorans LB400]